MYEVDERLGVRKVTDDCIDRISWSHCGINDEALGLIEQPLRYNQHVRWISLQNNKHLSGMGVVGLGRALSSAHRRYEFENPDRKFRGRIMTKRSPTVEELYLSGSPIG